MNSISNLGGSEQVTPSVASVIRPSPIGDRFAESGAVRVGTFLAIRWFAAAGQAVVILFTRFYLDLPLPLSSCVALITASVLLNLYLLFTRTSKAWLSPREASFELSFDILQLSLLLYLTGGLENPFSLMILAPITVAATVLSLSRAMALAVASGIVVTILAFVHEPLPLHDQTPHLPFLYWFGHWAALVLSAGFIAAYAGRVTNEARRMATALNATQSTLAREQRLSAVGALAAAAAHRLGSPLSTIAVVARELIKDVRSDNPQFDDLQLLLSETARCRDILATLSDSPESDSESAAVLDRPTLTSLIEEISEEWRESAIEVDVIAAPRDASPEPTISRQPELLHGLTNFIQNAAQFARARVAITVGWSQREASLTIADDGPGFSPAILARLGEPYISSRVGQRGHMGLGVFIAATLLARIGANVSFRNARRGGAEIIIRWRRSALASPNPTLEEK